MPDVTEPNCDDIKLKAIRKLLLDWIGKQGHDSCWYYPEIFRELCYVVGVEWETPNLPPRKEFEAGCCRYQEEVYPDFEAEQKLKEITPSNEELLAMARACKPPEWTIQESIDDEKDREYLRSTGWHPYNKSLNYEGWFQPNIDSWPEFAQKKYYTAAKNRFLRLDEAVALQQQVDGYNER